MVSFVIQISQQNVGKYISVFEHSPVCLRKGGHWFPFPRVQNTAAARSCGAKGKICHNPLQRTASRGEREPSGGGSERKEGPAGAEVRRRGDPREKKKIREKEH